MDQKDNPEKVPLECIPKGFRILTHKEKLELKELSLGVTNLKFVRMNIPKLGETGHSNWKIGASGTNEDITYIIDERFQFEKFVSDVRKRKAKGLPIFLN